MIDSIINVIDASNYYLCPGCRLLVKGKSLVKFDAFGLPFCVCRHCAENANEAITEALDRK